MRIVKRIADVIGLVADLAPGVLLLGSGLGLVVGGATGVLW